MRERAFACDFDSPESDGLVCIHSFKSDATNSGIWQRRSLVALELESAVLFPEGLPQHLGQSMSRSSIPKGAGFDIPGFFTLFHCCKRVSDVLPVGEKTGAACLGRTWASVLPVQMGGYGRTPTQ